MLRINKILFPTDFSECAEHAFKHASQLAALFDAEVHVFNTRVRQRDEYPALTHLLDSIDESSPEDASDDDTQRNISSRDDRVIVIEANASGPSACAAILKYAEDNEIDIIIMGTHGWRGPRRILVGSTTACVVRKSPCPVLSLRMDADAESDWNLNHLLVPVDFSKHSKEAVRQANELALELKGRISLIHVIEEMAIPTVYGIEPVALPQMEHLIESSDKELRTIRESLIDEAIDVELQTLIGRPAFLIADYAKEQKADVILMSTHGLTGIKRFMMGSVAESVIRTAPCAVLTIRSFKSLHSQESQAEIAGEV